MLRYKALSIIKTFSEEEVKKFKLFLASPYFNKQKKVAQFYEILLPFYPDFSDEKLNNEYLLRKIKSQKLSTLKNLFSDLYKLCLTFLHYAGYNPNSNQSSYEIISELEKRLQFKTALEHIDELTSFINNKKLYHTNDLFELFRLSCSKYNMTTFGKSFDDNEYVNEILNNINNANDYLFSFYFMVVSDYFIMVNNFSEHLMIEFEETKFGKFFNEFFPIKKFYESFNKNNFIKNEFYRNIFELKILFALISAGHDKYENSIRYIELLRKVAHKLDEDEKYSFFQIQNFWHPDLTLRKDFAKYEFEYYDDFFKFKSYKSEGYPKIRMKYIYYFLVRGNCTGRHEWTQSLINSYSDEFVEEEKESIIALRNSFVYLFSDKNPSKALDEINKIHHCGEVQVKRDIKSYSAIAYYELGHYDSTINQLQNLTKFLQRKDIPKVQWIFFKDFIKVVKHLCSAKLDNKHIEEELVIKQINEAAHFPHKDWVLAKVKEFNL